MKHDEVKYCILVAVIVLITSENMHAQTVTDDFKKQLKSNLRKEINFERDFHYQAITPTLNEKDEILTVSPTTKLPNRYDKIFNIPPKLTPNICMKVTSSKNNMLGENDYFTGKVIAIPNSQSIMQSAHYTRGDKSEGLSISNLDLDPVRAYQDYKARKRKVKVNRIKRAYGQE